jgi:signal transduction histidine kinase
LRDANAKLGQLDTAKTAFFSNVSHEFRTPLTLILGPVEQALAAPEARLEGADLAALHRNALRLLRLVNSLLDFSRIESGALSMCFAPTDLSALTAGLAGAFQSLFEAAAIELVVDCPPLPEPVYVDATHWEKVVMNLVSNAFKFTFEGQIAVRLRWRGDRVELQVSDTGTGIPESELPRIFERFHRVEGARGRSFEGTGIGLSLVHELVRLHGGEVRVQSEVGRGSTFVVQLPAGSAHLPRDRIVQIAAPAPNGGTDASAQLLEARQWLREAEAPISVASDRLEPPRPAANGARGRLLIADDNADMREYLKRLLSPHWDVELVANGRAALATALAAPPDLVLSDVMMPELDGVSLLAALRTDPRTDTVPVILISARAGEDARLAGLETGADDYLVKPFAAREVVTRVRTHLEMAKVRRAAAESARELAETRAALVRRLEEEHAALQTAYEKLQQTQGQLVQAAKMASLGELVAGIAHEINNPLAFALGHLNTVERGLASVESALKPELNPTAAGPWQRTVDRVREMRTGLVRIEELVNKLRTFSRLDEGERKRVSARDSIQSVLTILGHRSRNRITVTTHFGEPDIIDCYASLLNQALMNLLSNAIDAIDGEGSITIATGARDGWFEVVVADTGHGIPPGLRERVFEPFFTTKPVGEGTGLGLSISYSIIQKHGGQLTLQPRDGGGTVATIRLPLEAADGNAPCEATNSPLRGA